MTFYDGLFATTMVFALLSVVCGVVATQPNRMGAKTNMAATWGMFWATLTVIAALAAIWSQVVMT